MNREEYEKILVISDTHNNPKMIERVMKVEKYVDRVLHLGDLQGCDAIIKNATQAPLEAVRGNCDHDYDWPRETITMIGEHKVFMTHGHYYGVNYDTDSLEEAAETFECQVALYGHTHIPVLKMGRRGIWIANPGSLANPRQQGYKPTYLLIWHNKETGKLTFSERVLQ